MNLNFGSEETTFKQRTGCAGLLFLASLIAFPVVHFSSPANATVSLAEMARLSATEWTDSRKVETLFRGYLSLGMRREAANLLERKIHLAEISRNDATPLFEEVASEQSRWSDPGTLVEICEAALRNEVRTPLVLYSYATGLRLSGKFSNASANFAQIGQGSPFYPYALFAMGQIAAEEGRYDQALAVFRRLLEIIDRGVPKADSLKKRVTRSVAEVLLVLGRPGEAAPLFETLITAKAPLARIGWAAAIPARETIDEGLPPEMIALWPVRKKIYLSLLQGGLSRERGEFDRAVGHLTRAEEDLDASLVLATLPSTEIFEGYENAELLDRQIEGHRLLRHSLASVKPGEGDEAVRAKIVELLIGLLFMDHSIARAHGLMPQVVSVPDVRFLSGKQVEEIIRRIEQVTLDGVEAERLVEDLSKKVDIFQNLAHPIDRYRLLTKLEKNLEEIQKIKERIVEQREKAIAGVKAAETTDLSPLLIDMGKFLKELDEVRSASGEMREFTHAHFNILKARGKTEETSWERMQKMASEALSFDNDRFTPLLPSVKALEERARVLSWERKKQELAALRTVVARQLVDALVAQARHRKSERTISAEREAWGALGRAASYLSGNRLSARDKEESAVHIASLLAERNERWERFPGRTLGETERELIARILPLLKTGAQSGDRRDEAMFLLATLRIMAGDPEGRTMARDFLRKFPASPFAGDLAVRLAHEALFAGKTVEAVGFYRSAAESSRRESSGVARYMLGWARFQTGDSAEAARELSVPLSDPSFPCDQPSPFERAVVSLAVHVWRDTPLEKIRSYPPVQERACGGKLLLTSLGEEEEKRGEASRAAAVYDALAMEFPADEAAPSYEKRVVENLLRAGKEDQAFSRALTLGEKYGPGSLWAKNQKPSVRENAGKELSAMLKNLSERKFEEGIRSGESKAISAARAGIEKYFAGKEEGKAGGDPELQLKWAITSLKTGDRKAGVSVLHDLAQQRSDSLGEQAAILYAETMIAGYERKEETAENAENAAILLLDKFPTEKGSALAYRAAAALLEAGEYGRSVHTAEKIIQYQATPKPLLLDARLVHTEASIYLNNLAAARAEADSILGEASGKDASRARERARDLYLLSSLKQAEEKTAAEDWIGAARMLEELGGRFPEIPEAPSYFLRAVRSYMLGQDSDGAIRVGSEFLDKFPRREEAFEIVNTVAPLLIARDKHTDAADFYAKVAEKFPRNEQAPGFLFRAAQLNADHGRPSIAIAQFASYRGKYSNPHWMTVHATLSAGILAWKGGDAKTGIREIEAGIRQMEAGVEEDAPREFFALGGRARIILGEHWGDQFRKVKLVIPLEKSLAIKDRFFRRALGSFAKAKDESPIEVALEGSQMAGDMFVDFGKSILDSQRPKGLSGETRERYEEELKARARTFFEESQAWYLGALDRLEAEGGPSYMAIQIRQRLEAAQELLSGVLAGSEGR